MTAHKHLASAPTAKERGVRLSAFDVRGLRAGTQHVLRAEIRFTGYPRASPPADIRSATALEDGRWVFTDQQDGGGNVAYARCPYGQVGQRLWGQEAWHYSSGDAEMGEPSYWCYQADTDAAYPDGWDELPAEDRPAYARWKAAGQMPREACRLELEVTALRCERVQDMSELDAYAFGCVGRMCQPCDESGRELSGPYAGEPCGECSGEGRFSLLDDFRRRWSQTNGPDSWRENRWVWVASVRVLSPGEAAGSGGEKVAQKGPGMLVE